MTGQKRLSLAALLLAAHLAITPLHAETPKECPQRSFSARTYVIQKGDGYISVIRKTQPTVQANDRAIAVAARDLAHRNSALPGALVDTYAVLHGHWKNGRYTGGSLVHAMDGIPDGTLHPGDILELAPNEYKTDCGTEKQTVATQNTVQSLKYQARAVEKNSTPWYVACAAASLSALVSSLLRKKNRNQSGESQCNHTTAIFCGTESRKNAVVPIRKVIVPEESTTFEPDYEIIPSSYPHTQTHTCENRAIMSPLEAAIAAYTQRTQHGLRAPKYALTVSAICAQSPVSKYSLYTALARRHIPTRAIHHREWQHKAHEYAQTQYMRGQTVRDISQDLGVQCRTVRKYLQKQRQITSPQATEFGVTVRTAQAFFGQ